MNKKNSTGVLLLDVLIPIMLASMSVTIVLVLAMFFSLTLVPSLLVGVVVYTLLWFGFWRFVKS